MAGRRCALESLDLNFVATPIDGLWEVQTRPHGDARGGLTRTFCAQAFAAHLQPGIQFVQTNLSRTEARATVRGLHFQRAPLLEAKLVRCLRGAVHDVVVDLRAGSPSFGRWHAVRLDEHEELELLIPPGCAHGFQTLSDRVQMLYQHSAPYTPASEGGVRHDDPALAIAWPLPVGLVSKRDRCHPLIDDQFQGVQL